MKNILILLFLFHLLLSIQAIAQPVLEPQSLHFHSTLETEVLSLPILAPPTELEAKIRFLMAPDATAEEADIERALNGVNQLIKQLEVSNLTRKKLEKAAKILFNSVHDGLLVKYDEQAVFNQIFTTGTYNCVTASALYTLVLDHFGMKYQIRELPTHVYLILNSDSEQLVLESTDPSLGIFQINKEKAIQMLVEQKIISEAEYRRKGIDELYHEYLETEEKDINLRQLVGDLYYNQALTAYQEEEGLAAFATIKPLLENLNDGSKQAEQVIGGLFGAISSYYVRITNYDEAERWLEEGLKLVPESTELIRKKKLLEE